MPSTGPPLSANSRTASIDRGEPGDRACAQVVAVAEAAGHDDSVDAVEARLLVPDHPGLADPLAGRQRVPLVAGAGELEDAEHGQPISWIS